MPTTFTDWTSVNSQGKINDDLLPSDYFQLKYATHAAVYFTNDAAGAAAALIGALGGVAVPVTGVTSVDVTQAVKFQVIRDGAVVFEALMTFVLHLVAEIEDLGGGTVLAIYVWSIDFNHSTTVVSVPDPSPPILGSPGTSSDPAAGGDSTNAVGIVLTDIVSPAYQFRLEPGDIVAVPFHNAGQDSDGIVKLANVQVRTILGPKVLRTVFDATTGQTHTLYANSAGLQLARTRRMVPLVAVVPEVGVPVADIRSVVKTGRATFGNLHRDGGTLLCPYQAANLELAVSYDEGETWEVAMASVAGITPLATALSGQGDTLYVYGVATAAGDGYASGDVVYAVLKRSGAGFALAAIGLATPPAGGTLPKKDVAGLQIDGGTLRLSYKVNNDLHVLSSEDELHSFKELALS